MNFGDDLENILKLIQSLVKGSNTLFLNATNDTIKKFGEVSGKLLHYHGFKRFVSFDLQLL